MASTGLQALILCGPGSSFPTFTSNPDENPKALLPIANRPMVWYPIDYCLRTGITSITLICPSSASQALTAAFNTSPYLTSLPSPRPDILACAGLDQNMGTAEILRLDEVRGLVTGDFIVLPCDLVCEPTGEQLLQAWMVKSANLAHTLRASRLTNGAESRHNGGLGVWYDTKTSAPVKGEETDFIATAPLPAAPVPHPKGSILPDLARLVYSVPTDSLNDLMEERKGLPFRHGLLRAHPRLRVHTTHRDAHIYVFPRWILDFVRENEHFESIAEDVVGWWAKAGWQPRLADKLHFREVCGDDDNGRLADADAETGSVADSNAVPSEAGPDAQADRRKSSGDLSPRGVPTIATNGPPEPALPAVEPPPILAHIHPSKAQQEPGSILRRVDTAQLLLAVSLQLAKLPSVEEVGPEAASPFAHPRKIAFPEGVKSRTTITKQDSLIGENVTVEEKTSIKECIIGANCQIQEGAKLSQCLLMEGVVVGKGCKLTKCILGKRCVIGDGSVLTDCEVQENLLVEERTEDKENRLMSSDGLEASQAEMDEVLHEMDQEVAATLGDTAMD
ncbi:Translation initiation factor eIF-2B subunit gamma [Escovopsis weberi]|uniref:Translation initiation factor eIF2B subunit gamma n=1 Tax=Escovopsis weberi TaxID=150374 RepID=A0A0N0RU42_ESCWE|nr:Translation initiation factor eIF-2B subunit gamma [Escovopsis weberi]